MTRACSARGRDSNKSKKCFVKRQESVVINEPEKRERASAARDRRRNVVGQQKMKRDVGANVEFTN